MPSKAYEVEYDGQVSVLEYVFEREVAVLEGGLQGRFQELPLLEEIRRRDLHGIYIDGGAHIGNHSIFFAKHCPSSCVIAIEGHPAIYQVLVRNLIGNALGKFEAHNAALWKECKDAWMGPIVPNNAGRTQLCGDGRRFATRRDAKVQAKTLDSMFPAPDSCVLLKLDIEDCEVQAIEGAAELVQRCRPLIVAEHHNAKFLRAFRDHVEPWGYTLNPKTFDPRGETRIWEPPT